MARGNTVQPLKQPLHSSLTDVANYCNAAHRAFNIIEGTLTAVSVGGMTVEQKAKAFDILRDRCVQEINTMMALEPQS